ncbi:hypothetical protein AB0892_08380 [Streptomyces sp. NPDC005409]|uniref:hypothetical protein n=1 Tax=Streptomyces sp. NPDC005409 TaxID=3155342 RepID=UPI003451942A
MPKSKVQPPRTGPQSPPESSFLGRAAFIAAPGTAVIGLLYYFGSTYNTAYYSSFGVPEADLQFSVQAHLVKSTDAVFLPLWLMSACALVVLLDFGWVKQVLARPRNEARRGVVIRWLLGLGLLTLLMGLLACLSGSFPRLSPTWIRELLPPLVVGFGATMAFPAIFRFPVSGRVTVAHLLGSLGEGQRGAQMFVLTVTEAGELGLFTVIW